MAETVYILAMLTCLVCVYMLLREYRRSRVRLLLWIGICFFGLALNNVLFFLDVVVTPDINFYGSFVRNLIGTASGGILVYGLLWELL